MLSTNIRLILWSCRLSFSTGVADGVDGFVGIGFGAETTGLEVDDWPSVEGGVDILRFSGVWATDMPPTSTE